MLRKNSGITLIALVYTIIVIIILASIFVATSMNALREARNSEIQSEIHSLEEAISIRYASHLKNENSVNTALVGISPKTKEDLSTYTKCVEAIKNSVPDGVDNELKLSNDLEKHFDDYVKIITAYEASILGVEPFKSDSIYIVDYFTSTAYGPILEEYMN